MLSKNTESVNIVAAQTSPFGARARREEGVRGRNPAARALARSRAENFAFPFRRKNQACANQEKAKQNFLRGRPPLAVAGGGAGQFCSKWVRAKDIISPQRMK